MWVGGGGGWWVVGGMRANTETSRSSARARAATTMSIFPSSIHAPHGIGIENNYIYLWLDQPNVYILIDDAAGSKFLMILIQN